MNIHWLKDKHYVDIKNQMYSQRWTNLTTSTAEQLFHKLKKKLKQICKKSSRHFDVFSAF